VATDKKSIVEKGAVLAFLDQSGISTTPFVQRTWAPISQTPILKHWMTRSRFTLMGVITLSPRLLKPYLYLQLYPNRGADGDDVAAFLANLTRLRRGPVVVLLDRAPIHKSEAVKEVLRRHPNLSLEFLPAYSPELNPIEWLWGYLKSKVLANFAPDSLWQLGEGVVSEALEVQQRPELLHSFIRASALDVSLPV
jgi:transposase